MPDFELEQMDGEEGATIDLPHGDTVIGRGPFLGVSDKRVSRNHGILENVDGQLRLKPTHVNPFFVQTSAEASPQPLVRDQWHQLRDGSVFSLLPGKCLYRVRAVAEGWTPRNSQGFEEKAEEETEQISESSRSCEETLAYTPRAKNGPSFTYETSAPDPAACHKVGGDSHSSCKSDVPDPLTLRKTRVLPAWMMAATPAALNTSPAKAATKRPLARRARNATPSSKPSDDEDEEEGCSKAPRKRARRLKSDTEERQDQAPVSASSPERTQRDEDANAAKKPDKREKKKESKKAEGNQASNAGGSNSVPENSGTLRTNLQRAKVRSRTQCPYGTACYRKNPVHFQECSHPGDDDYGEEQTNADVEDDDRPECPYGTDCYRKNPLHKKEYKHTKPPAKKTTLVNEDDEDEDQYENSFINDDCEEEDAEEDSDYVPESEDSEKEDVKRLQKEAKAFLQRKK